MEAIDATSICWCYCYPTSKSAPILQSVDSLYCIHHHQVNLNAKWVLRPILQLIVRESAYTIDEDSASNARTRLCLICVLHLIEHTDYANKALGEVLKDSAISTDTDTIDAMPWDVTFQCRGLCCEIQATLLCCLLKHLLLDTVYRL